MISAHLSNLKGFIERFAGYGNPKASLWFVGMEEGSGQSLDEVGRRVQVRLQEVYPNRRVKGIVITGRENDATRAVLETVGYDISWYCYRVSFEVMGSASGARSKDSDLEPRIVRLPDEENDLRDHSRTPHARSDRPRHPT